MARFNTQQEYEAHLAACEATIISYENNLDFRGETYADWVYRKNELQRSKLIPFYYHFAEDDKKLWYSFVVPNIYAIWEGFVNNILTNYLKEVSSLGLRKEEINDSLLFYSVDMKFNNQLYSYGQTEDKYPIDKKIEFIKKLNDFLNNNFVIYDKINSESNVGFDILNKLLSKLKFNKIEEYAYPNYSLAEKLGKKGNKNAEAKPDSLLGLRNSLAHGSGEEITVTKEMISEFITLINNLMIEVFYIVAQGFENECYRKT